MAESTLSYPITDLQTRVKRFLGITATTLSATESADVEDCIQSGLRQFYWPPPVPGERTVHRWSFMKLELSVDSAASAWEITPDDDFGNLLSDYLTFDYDESQSHHVKVVTPEFIYRLRQNDESTGAPKFVAVRPVATMATFTGTAAVNDTPVNGDTNLTIDTVATSNTVTTTVSIGARFTIAGETNVTHTVTGVTPAEGTGPTTNIVFTPSLTTAAGIPADDAVITFTSIADGQRFQLIIHPIADAVYTMYGWYEPCLDKISTALPWPFGGSQHTETVIESVLSIAEQRINDERGLHFDRFLERLASSVSLDRQRGPRNYGYNSDTGVLGGDGYPEHYIKYQGVRYDNR